MAQSMFDTDKDLDFMVLYERSAHTIRENLANGGSFLNLNQCLFLSRKLLETIQNIRELISHCRGSGAARFRPALEFLHRCLRRADVLVSRCGSNDWVKVSLFLDKNGFLEILTDVADCYEVIYALAKPASGEWNDLPDCAVKMFETSENSCLIGSGAHGHVYKATWLGVECAMKTFKTSENSSSIGAGAHARIFTGTWLGRECAVKIFHEGALKPNNLDVDAVLDMQKDLHNDISAGYSLCKLVKGTKWSRQKGSVSKLLHESCLKDILEDVDMSSGKVGVHDFLPEKATLSDIFQSSLPDELHLLPQKENDFDLAGKGIPTRIWSAEEIHAVLKLTQEVARVSIGRYIWDYVSENLFKRYGFDRASDSCQQQWEALLKSFNAIRELESKIQSGTSRSISYWEMDEDKRSKNKLPQAFDLGWYEMIESILIAKPLDKETSSIHVGAHLPSSGLPLCHSGSAHCGRVIYDEFMDSEFEDSDTQSQDEEGSGDSTATIESQARVPVGSHVPQTKETSASGDETNSNWAGRKRSAAEAMEDSLISVIVPFVSKQIEDALKPLLAVLKSREEELNHPKKLACRAGEAGSKAGENATYTTC